MARGGMWFSRPTDAIIRPMPITRETNGHWTGNQWALNPKPMGIEFQTNGH